MRHTNVRHHDMTSESHIGAPTIQAALAEAKAAGETAQEAVAAVSAELATANAGAEQQREYVQQLEGALCIQPPSSCFGRCRIVRYACVLAAALRVCSCCSSYQSVPLRLMSELPAQSPSWLARGLLMSSRVAHEPLLCGRVQASSAMPSLRSKPCAPPWRTPRRGPRPWGPHATARSVRCRT